MATPQRAEYVSFSHSSQTLMCGSRAIDCHDWLGLFAVGPSRGANRILPGLAGRVARPHLRDELPVELPFRCRGAYDDDNVRQDVATHRANLLARLSEVRAFLDTAPDRQLSVTLTTSGGSSSADCTFLAFGPVQFVSDEIAEFRVLITLVGGLIAVPVAP